MPTKIRSFQDIIDFDFKDEPIVTLFSGGLDSAFLLYKLQKAGYSQVHALCVDLGEGVDAFKLRKTATSFGAKLIEKDLKAAFTETAVRPALRAQARYLGSYPVSSSLSRPVIVEAARRHAASVGAVAIFHTANQSQNSLRRLNQAIEYGGFEGFYGSPYEYSAVTREEKAAELATQGLSFFAERKLSGDANLWCREFESGPLDNPEQFEIPEEAFTWTKHSPTLAPIEITLGFEVGNLVSLDGESIDFQTAISRLNQEIGAFGHGRFVGLEHLYAGEKVLEVREAPAALVTMDTLRQLEMATLDAASIAFKQSLEPIWTTEAVEGRWYSNLKQAAQAGIDHLCQRVTGSVTLRVTHQSCLPISIRAEKPLYLTDRDQWELEITRLRGARSLSDLIQPQGGLDVAQPTAWRIAG